MLHDFRSRRRRAEMIDADQRPLVTRPAFPAERRSGFDRHTPFECRRKNAFAVIVALCGEQVPAGHAHDARFHTVTGQLFLRFHTEGHF